MLGSEGHATGAGALITSEQAVNTPVNTVNFLKLNIVLYFQELPRGPAAIDTVGFAIHHRGFVAREINRSSRDLLGRSEFAARNFSKDKFSELGIFQSFAREI